MNFSKMNGNGNDFLILNNMSLDYKTEELINITKKICRRKEALGADGVLVIEPSVTDDFKMRLFNRDGSEGEMCGNGARCLARYAYIKGVTKKNKMTFETLAGRVEAEVDGINVKLYLSPVDISDFVMNEKAEVEGYRFEYNFLTVGVPHTVIFEEKRLSNDEYYSYGKLIRNRLDLFPDGTNVNFVLINKDKKDTLDVITYERGVEDLTLSCGTGSAACGIASCMLGITSDVVNVNNPGGVNQVSVERNGNIVFPKLTGRALLVGEIDTTEEALY